VLRLCPPRRRWRSFGVLFDSHSSRSRDAAPLVQAHLPRRRALLLGPAYSPLREIGAALVSHTKHALELRVHTASGLPLVQDSTLLHEDLSYVAFVVDMADRHSFSLFRDLSALVLPSTLQRCGVALVYGADDDSSHAFPLLEFLQAASHRAVQVLFTSAPQPSTTGLEDAVRAGATRLASLFEGDADEVSRQHTLLLRMQALQKSLERQPR